MGDPSTSSRRIERVDASSGHPRVERRDELALEAPLELRIRGVPVIVVMRTPGADEDLARGLLWTEGVIADVSELGALQRPAPGSPEEEGNVLELGLDPCTHHMPERSLYSSASCGVCGKTAIAALEVRAAPIRAGLEVSAEVIVELPERLRGAQPVFGRTGGLHAAGIFDGGGALLFAAEDVGRHNAVDKVIGWALRTGRVPMSGHILCVSGRASFEIVQKAVMAGFEVIAAVSAPSSLAVDLAERFRVTLCGFVRDRTFNIYSHALRIRGPAGSEGAS